MPSYSFKNNDTGEEFEQILSMSEREKFLEQNPHIHQLPSLFAMSASGTGDRIKVKFSVIFIALYYVFNMIQIVAIFFDIIFECF